MLRDGSLGNVRRFFAGMTEYAFFCRLGVTDPPLIDYISELLTRFVYQDQVFRLRTPTGKRLDQVVDMLTEAQLRQGLARRDVHRHIGDFTLFWTGVYPEAVEHLRGGRKDSLVDYRAQGKRAYQIASSIPTDPDDIAGTILERLSVQFELCAYGLGEVRREWERRDDGGDAPLPLWGS